MERRRKNNIIIGTLCAVLVLMGVGYAILSTTLNIGGTANITGDFDIHFTSIQRSSSTISDSTILSTIDAGTGITANTSSRAGTFTAVLQKPTDYVIYTVSVANTGSIDGYLTFSFEDTNSNFDYYKDFYSVEFIRDDVNPAISTDILQPNASFSDPSVLVNTNGTRTYKIKVTFKESATSFPDPTHEINNQAVGNFECSLNLTYSQQAPSNNQNSFVSNGWEVDSNGKVIAYNPNDIVNGVLTIPATTGVNGTGDPIVSIDTESFAGDWTLAIYYDTDWNVLGTVIRDEDNYNTLRQIAINDFEVDSSKIVTSIEDLNIPNNTEYFGDFYKPDTTKEYSQMTEEDKYISTLIQPTLTSVDFSNASNLEVIGTGTFRDEMGDNDTGLVGTITIPSSVEVIGSYAFGSNKRITGLDLSNATSLTTIGNYAFNNCRITSLAIPSNLETIGASAFTNNEMTSLDLTHATGLISIGDWAFDTAIRCPSYNCTEENRISLDFTVATHLTTIGSNAFKQYPFKSVILPSNVTTIGAGAFDQRNNGYTLSRTITIKRADSTGMTLGTSWNGSATVIYDPS